MDCGENIKIGILGSTGSIGLNTIEIIRNHKNIELELICARGSNPKNIIQQCIEFKPKYVFLENHDAIALVESEIDDKTQVFHISLLKNFSSDIKLDACIAAIDGFGGVIPTFLMTKCSKKLLIANKEVIVCTWSFIKKSAQENDCQIVPIDSEHNSIYQLLQGRKHEDVKNITLTASGGPLFKYKGDLDRVKKAKILKHPKWKMGFKNTVNSATLMNKGLELIEACCLFNMPCENVKLVIHPQALIHGIVTWNDSSSTALFSNPDMKIHISSAIFDKPFSNGCKEIDFTRNMKLDFFSIDNKCFPSILLAQSAFEAGVEKIIQLNAINEACLKLFYEDRLPFSKIMPTIQSNISNDTTAKVKSIEDAISLHDEIYAKFFIDREKVD